MSFYAAHCHGCGQRGDRMAMVSDPFMDACYGLCARCLSKCLPDAQEMIQRLDANAPGGPGWPAPTTPQGEEG